MATTKKTTKKTDTIDTDSHPLADFIPAAYYYEEYVTRTLSGGVLDLDMMTTAHNLRHNVLLFGPTGSAKTSFVYAYAAMHNIPVVNVPCNGGIDVRQLIGGWSPRPDGGYQFTPGELVLGVQHGAIILLNEVNFMPPKIASLVYGLLDRRRTVYLPDAAGSDFPTQIKAHPRTLVVADYNPGYAGTRPLNEAFRNRFAFKIEWGYDTQVEQELVTSPTLIDMANKLRLRADAGDLSMPVPTNVLMEFEELAQDEHLGLDFAINNFINFFPIEEQPVVREVVALHSSLLEQELFDSES